MSRDRDFYLSERRFQEIKQLLEENPDNADELDLLEYETFMEMEEDPVQSVYLGEEADKGLRGFPWPMLKGNDDDSY